jgi:hypothetical protein
MESLISWIQHMINGSANGVIDQDSTHDMVLQMESLTRIQHMINGSAKKSLTRIQHMINGF